jgi:hypothetical protein
VCQSASNVHLPREALVKVQGMAAATLPCDVNGLLLPRSISVNSISTSNALLSPTQWKTKKKAPKKKAQKKSKF